jgi:hypothetical protein
MPTISLLTYQTPFANVNMRESRTASRLRFAAVRWHLTASSPMMRASTD